MDKQEILNDIEWVKNSLIDKIHRFPTWLKKTFLQPSEAMKTFYGLCIVCILCFGYTWLNNDFTVPLSGDYTIQEMTFLYDGYDDWHQFFRTGVFPTWDRSIFLGIDNIGGNSFYYLFDPFFLILLPFPRDWLLVLQGLEFIPKMALAGMFFYWYLGEFHLSPQTRRIGALAFAFSAYSFSYLWFHFVDSVAFLPLVFLGVDRIIKRKDPRIFLVGFLLNAMASYFFFVVFMFGAFFYAVFRYLQTIKERTVSDNFSVLGLGVFSFLVAILLGCFTLLPGMATATNMSRVSSSSYLSNILEADGLAAKISAFFTYPYDHHRVTPLLNFLFLYDDCYSSNLLNVSWYDNCTAGLYATTPMLLLFFVSLIDSFRQRKWSHIIGLACTLFLIFTPLGFYLFSGFTVAYARYFIIPIAWMVVFDCQALERRRDIPRSYLDLSFVIVMILQALSCYLMIYEVELSPSRFSASSTLWDIKMFLIVGCMIWVCVCYVVMRLLFHKKHFDKAVFLMASIDIIVMANLTINFHGLSTASQASGITTETKIVQLLKESENNDDYYRIYNTTADRNNINISLREGYTGLGAFHSVYPTVAQDFIDRSRIPYTYHNWSMGIHNRRYNLETFLGTKYYLVDRVDPTYVNHCTEDSYTNLATPRAYPYSGNDHTWATDYDIPYGYKDVLKLTDEEKKLYGVDFSSDLLKFLNSEDCNKTLYINTNFIDFGFSFDQVINAYWLISRDMDEDDEPYYNDYEDENEYPLLRAAMLENEDYKKFLAEGKYKAGTYTINGHTVDIEGTSSTSLYRRAQAFRQAQVGSNGYVEGSSAPIQLYQVGSGQNRLKITIYSAQWPATDSNPSGEYASCDPEDANDMDCTSSYAKEHPWEYQNGIRQADYKYDYETLKDDYGNTSENYTYKLLYNSKIVITPVDSKGNPTTILPDADPNDPSTGGYISVFDQRNIEWRFFDENDKVISFAKHSYAEYKQAHGYYVDRPVAKILGIIKSGSKTSPVNYSNASYLYVQRNKDYQEAIDSLKKYAPTISYRNDTEVDFSTDYTEDRFMVTNYPKVNGWNLYEKSGSTLTPVTTYKTQGGFIGFEAKAGSRQYVLSYTSPNFNTGCVLTAFGIMITFAAFVFFSHRNHDRYGKGNDRFASLHYNFDQEVLKEKWNYANYK